MDQNLKRLKIELLEKLAKNTPHLIASISLTPIALPYAIFELALWPCDENVDTETVDFFNTNQFASFWKRGFVNLRDAVKEYRENKLKLLDYAESRYS
jgi:hypothetical protein